MHVETQRKYQSYARSIFHLTSAMKIKTRIPVNLREGRLLGIIEQGYHGPFVCFKGIPYASPPVGDLRFKDPVPVKPWSGDRHCIRHGNLSLQINHHTGDVMGDEDCLTLSVFAPNMDHSKKRPVMVWIHGGGFYSGYGNTECYGPDYLLTKDVVVVTMNYRLGVLGFLNLGDGTQDEVATGNQGLKDIVMALRWVRDNISKFTGDPENVTIFGADSGGAAVHFLALSPYAQGLFHKAISQSGLATNRWLWCEKVYAVNKGFELAKQLGKETVDSKAVYEFFKTLDAKTLLKGQASIYTDEYMRKIMIPFPPSMDAGSPNPFFPEHISKYLSRGVKVPFIMGNTAAEGVAYVRSSFTTQKTKEELEYIDADFSRVLSPLILTTIEDMLIDPSDLRALYFGDKAVSNETILALGDFYTDSMFYRGTMEVADVQANLNSGNTYLYRFSYQSKTPSMFRLLLEITLPGVAHYEDPSYLLYCHMAPQCGLQLLKPNTEEYTMMDYMTQMWTDFAKTGNPTPNITNLTPVQWTPLKSGDTYDYLDINSNSEMKAFVKGKERWYWENRKSEIKQ